MFGTEIEARKIKVWVRTLLLAPRDVVSSSDAAQFSKFWN